MKGYLLAPILKIQKKEGSHIEVRSGLWLRLHFITNFPLPKIRAYSLSLISLDKVLFLCFDIENCSATGVHVRGFLIFSPNIIIDLPKWTPQIGKWKSPFTQAVLCPPTTRLCPKKNWLSLPEMLFIGEAQFEVICPSYIRENEDLYKHIEYSLSCLLQIRRDDYRMALVLGRHFLRIAQASEVSIAKTIAKTSIRPTRSLISNICGSS